MNTAYAGSALPATNELAFNLQHVFRAQKTVQFIIQRLTAENRDSINLYLHLSLKLHDIFSDFSRPCMKRV